MRKYWIAFSLICVMFAPSLVQAADFQTKEGYVIPESDYNKLKLIHTDEYLYLMPESKYFSLMSSGLDFDSLTQTEAFIKTTYNHVTGETIDEEITEEECIEASKNNIEARSSTYYETSYKRITLNMVNNATSQIYVNFTTSWYKIPATRSYDVSAFRLANCEVLNGTQGGKQIYTLNGEDRGILYSWNGTNINNFDNGFGISMNIVNDDITDLQLTIDSYLLFETLPAGGFASYQHATSNVSLATSKNYTIGAGGYGGVIKFAGDIGQSYDGMQGIYTYISGNN